jgi:hypothetical protein
MYFRSFLTTKILLFQTNNFTFRSIDSLVRFPISKSKLTGPLGYGKRILSKFTDIQCNLHFGFILNALLRRGRGNVGELLLLLSILGIVYELLYVLPNIYYRDISLVWCPRQEERISSLPFYHGCRKRRLIWALTSEMDCDQTAMGLLPETSAVFLIAKSFW